VAIQYFHLISANLELTGKFWSEAKKLVRVKRFVMGQFD